MPTGPQGQKSPRDVVGCAVTVMKIATGEIEEKIGTERQEPSEAEPRRSTQESKGDIRA